MKKLFLLIVVFLFVGCASYIGKPDQGLMDKGFSGAPEPLRIGIYVDRSIEGYRTDKIIEALKTEFAPYGIKVEIPWIRPWERKGFRAYELMTNIAKLPLEFPCDRILVIIGRHAGDVAWGLFLPEILGAVEDVTRTKGYVVGEIGSINQVLMTPTDTAVHEVYHMLGCEDSQSGWGVHNKTTTMRKLAQENRQKKGQNFFPSMSEKGQIFWNRKDVELVLDKAVFE